MGRRLVHQPQTGSSPGPFSPAVGGGGITYLSGQVGIDPVTGRLIDGGVADQTARALENVIEVLRAGGRTLGDVVRVGVYLTDMTSYAEMNRIYQSYFRPPYPARTTIGVAALPLGAAVEIDAVVA